MKDNRIRIDATVKLLDVMHRWHIIKGVAFSGGVIENGYYTLGKTKLYYLVNETTDELLEKARGEYYETMLANTLMKWLGMYR